MRAIKFRVWDPRPDGWRGWIHPDCVHEVLIGIRGEIPQSTGPFAMEISQFTGLLDANGREIYDGDIVRSEHSGSLYLVNWDPDGPGWAPFLWKYIEEHAGGLSGRLVVVVGNRWENPALAEECEG